MGDGVWMKKKGEASGNKVATKMDTNQFGTYDIVSIQNRVWDLEDVVREWIVLLDSRTNPKKKKLESRGKGLGEGMQKSMIKPRLHTSC